MRGGSGEGARHAGARPCSCAVAAHRGAHGSNSFSRDRYGNHLRGLDGGEYRDHNEMVCDRDAYNTHRLRGANAQRKNGYICWTAYKCSDR